MSRLLVTLFCLFFVITTCLAISAADIQKQMSELKSQFKTLTKEQQKAFEALENYTKKVHLRRDGGDKNNTISNTPSGSVSNTNPPPPTFFDPNNPTNFSVPPSTTPVGTLPPNPQSGANGTNAPPPNSPQGVYLNGFYFVVRETVRVDLEPFVQRFIDKHCILVNCSSNPYVKQFLTDIAQFVLIESFDAAASQGSGEFDLLLHLFVFPGNDTEINTILSELFNLAIYPSTGVSYFGGSASYTPGLPASGLNFTAQGFAIQHTYTHVIEYQDINGNKVYDLGEEVQIINLSTIPWTVPIFRTVNVSNYVVHEFFTQTADGVASFVCRTSNFPVYDPNGVLLHPNGTKCDHLIQNFPFQQNGSYLAVRAQVLLSGGRFQGTAVNGSIEVVPADPDHFLGGHFHWAASVVSNGTRYPVIANVSSQITIQQIQDFTARFFTLDSGQIAFDVRNVTFSFLTPPNPTSFHWDPEIAYGEDTNNPPSDLSSGSPSSSPSSSSPSSSSPTTSSPTSKPNSASSLALSLFAIFAAFAVLFF